MKALTVLQPWAWCIATGRKKIENRSWKTSYRGPLAIHAGKSRKELEIPDHVWECWLSTKGLPRIKKANLIYGAVIATCNLVDCIPLAELGAWRWSGWEEGPFCWLLDNIVQLPEPIYMRGFQGFWEADMTPKPIAADLFTGPT